MYISSHVSFIHTHEHHAQKIGFYLLQWIVGRSPDAAAKEVVSVVLDTAEDECDAMHGRFIKNGVVAPYWRGWLKINRIGWGWLKRLLRYQSGTMHRIILKYKFGSVNNFCYFLGFNVPFRLKIHHHNALNSCAIVDISTTLLSPWFNIPPKSTQSLIVHNTRPYTQK